VLFSFSTTFVSDVLVKNSDGATLYHESRNGDFYAKIFPDRLGNITLEITPLCSDCKFDQYASLRYTFYARYPYYEIRIVLNGVILASAFVISLNDFREYHPVKRLRWLIALVSPVAALLLASWYLYAFGYDQWFAVLLAALSVATTITLSLIIPKMLRDSKAN
jgi:hypothetical protein